jgi:crossover junction endodeoxyribonuclease RuvC
MTPIGLDLSLTSTGVSIDGVVHAIKSKLRDEPRLIEIRDTILQYVRSCEDPVVILEGFSFGSRNSQAHAIGGLGWIVRVALHEAGIPWTEMAPTARAKLATGKGNAKKSEVVSHVSARTGIVFKTDDEVDAWVLEEAGLIRAGRARFDWPKANLEALDKVDWTRVGL